MYRFGQCKKKKIKKLSKIGYIVRKLLSFLNFGKLGSIFCFENKINNLFISNGKQVTNRHVDKTEPSIDSIEVIFSYVL